MFARVFIWGLVAAALAVALPQPGAQATPNSLTVLVKDLRSDSGTVRIGLWNTAEGFTQKQARVAGRNAPVKDGNTEFVFEGLAPGRYALIVYHDENDNGEFDRTLIGLPAEGLGFSNGAWINLFGAPSFEEAAIELKGPSKSTVISVRY